LAFYLPLALGIDFFFIYMCLITFNWLDHPTYKLALVANRDEFYDRKSASLHLWDSGIYAGRDLEGGGTWMGFHPGGKFAALTNYRGFTDSPPHPTSRGMLVKDFLENEEEPVEYLSRIKEIWDQYQGFNLLVAQGDEMYYLSNLLNTIQKVSPGLHGISNSFLDTPWPKVVSAKDELSKVLKNKESKVEDLMKLLQSRAYPPEEFLPQTGIPLEMEMKLSAQFIKIGKEYGTVNTSGLLWRHDGKIDFMENRTHPRVCTQIRSRMQQDEVKSSDF
jgi:uncharacterized protein with NRDE domain